MMAAGIVQSKFILFALPQHGLQICVAAIYRQVF